MSDETRERSRHAARDASAPPNGSDGNQTMIQPDGHLDAEMVSAWLDTPDDFNEQDRRAIENHLAGCAECRQVAAELTAIVRAFQILPYVDAPRSFALTAQMAGLAATPTLPAARRLEEPARLHERTREREARKPVELYEPIPWHERQMRALRWATAVAAMLFVFLISADVLGNIDSSGDDDDDSAPMSMDASVSTSAAGAMPASGASQATATSGPSSAAVMDPTVAAAEESDDPDDAVRSAEPTPTPASVSGAVAATEPMPTPAGGSAAEATAETTDDSVQEATPASANAEPTGEATDEAMTMMAPTEAEQADQAQQDDETTSAYSGEDVNASAESQESDTLHLIELALLILIAWLIVAMVALPRLRQPSG